MAIKLYNTLTKKKEIFKPIEENLLKIYICGVTVYDNVHLGHAFTYINYDVLTNYFRHFLDYDILHIRNITDVGHLTNDSYNGSEDHSGSDKIEERAIERNVHPMELVYCYTRKMWKDFDNLYIDRPNIEPTATGHIIEMQNWVKKMLKNGFAYEVEGNVYFDISKFEDYGKFAHINLDELKKDTRFKNDPNKKSPFDFALWIKANENHILKWDSPWGLGYPGWHLECSVMSTKYLGEYFDIHGGGIEHTFPHHQNEIAQNYGYYNHKVVNYWVHTAMLNVEGKKMGKSLGNFITIDEFLKENTAESLRYLVTSGHYRKPMNYTSQGIQDAQKIVDKMNAYIKRLQAVNENKNTTYAKEIIDNSINNFNKAMKDDLNTPSAWAAIFFLVRETNKLIEKDKLTISEANEILGFLQKVNLVFKVFTFKDKNECYKDKKLISESQIMELVDKRNQLRLDKDYEGADLIRLNLEKKGVILNDNGRKTTWHYKHL